MQTFKFVTVDDKKVYYWCTTNTLKSFRDFMQYILDSCSKPEDFMIWDVEKDFLYDAYKVATTQFEMRKRTFDERMDNAQTGKWFVEKVKMENSKMKRLRNWRELWIDGKQVRGIKNITPATIWELIDIYNAIIRENKPSFINSTVKEVLDKCGIETVVEGIGWRIV